MCDELSSSLSTLVDLISIGVGAFMVLILIRVLSGDE